MLLQLKDRVEIVMTINAADIEKNKLRSDLGITYDLDVIRLIDCFRQIGLYVGSIVMTRFTAQPTAIAFQKRLESHGVTATVRRRLGSDIDASCGQLRRKTMREKEN